MNQLTRRAVREDPNAHASLFSLLPQSAILRMLNVSRGIARRRSLGHDLYVILVEGQGAPDANHLLVLKLASPSMLTAQLKVYSQGSDDGAIEN